MEQAQLTSLLKQLPTKPGIYQMINAWGDVLYVGKASHLKKRVSSYFNRSVTGAKTQSLVKQIADIQVTVTASETEALLLESNLIKRLKPKYNILLRDDKTYPYVIVTTEHDYPRIDMVRSKSKPKSGHYFGPYPTVGAVKETLLLLQKIFKLRTCRDSQFSARTRPCLQYQIKRCTAPCVKLIAKQDYAQLVRHAIAFLQGKSQEIIEQLEQAMELASKQLHFEQAAMLRDQINSLRQVQQQQYINQGDVDADVIAIEVSTSIACVQVLTIRNGQVIASNHYFPKLPRNWLQQDELDSNQIGAYVLEAFISQHYLLHAERIPRQIIARGDNCKKDLLSAALTQVAEKTCTVITKPRGVKAKWLDMAETNASISVTSYRHSQQRVQERYHALQQLLNLSYKPQRMECFDVSHTMGEATVASCVVFGSEGPLTHDYRRFNIKDITPGDDYAAMKQALNRRYQRIQKEAGKLPDILFIDGGKGQVSQAVTVFDDLGIDDVIIIGVAKGPGRKAGWETLILTHTNQEINLPIDSPALHLIQHIRDEAHRFAITSHRNKRHKARFESSLEQIEGVGAKRRQALLKRFGGIKALAKAPVEEIAKVKGVSIHLAEKIQRALQE